MTNNNSIRTIAIIGDVITFKNRHGLLPSQLMHPADSDHVVTGVYMGGVTVEGDDRIIFHFYYDVKVAKQIIATVPQSKTQLLESLKDLEQLDFLPVGTTHVGGIDTVYPEYKNDWYRTDIWKTEDGVLLATWDTGNGHGSFMCEGTLDVLSAYIEAEDQKRRDEMAVPGSIVMFPENPALAGIQNIHDFSFRAETVSPEGITIAGYDQLFAHNTYII